MEKISPDSSTTENKFTNGAPQKGANATDHSHAQRSESALHNASGLDEDSLADSANASNDNVNDDSSEDSSDDSSDDSNQHANVHADVHGSEWQRIGPVPQVSSGFKQKNTDLARDLELPLQEELEAASADSQQALFPVDFKLDKPEDGPGNEGFEELELLSTPKIDAPVLPDETLMTAIDEIPKKMAFKIGEVAQMLGVKQYVLRYWETEFEALKPKKSRNNQRIYTRKDVEVALLIKKLLYHDRFSIEGARTALRHLKSQVKEEKDWRGLAQVQEHAITGLRELMGRISRFRDSL